MGKPLAPMQRNQLLHKASNALGQGDAGTAFKAAAQVAKNDTSDIDALIMLSQVAPGAGKVREALRIFASAMKSGSNNEDTLVCWGNLKAAAGDLPGAEDAFRRAGQVAPASVGPRLNLANILVQTGKYVEAVSIFNSLLDAGGGWQVQLGLANASMMAGDLQQAESAFLATLKFQPNHVGAHNNLGRIFMERGFLDRSGFHLEKAISLQPNNTNVLLNIASLKRRQGDVDDAIEVMRQVISLDPQLVNAYANLSDTLERANRLDEARGAVQDGLSKFPNHLGLLVQAAKLDRRSGKIDDAINRLKDTGGVQSDIKNTAALHQELGVLYDKKDQTAKAFEHFTVAKHHFCELSRQLGVDHEMFFNEVAAMDRFVQDTDFRSLQPLNTDDGRKDPCFLIGFLRSGTTLLHQILDSHTEVTVVDEKPAAIAAMEILASDRRGYPDGIASIDDSTARRARKAYFETLDSYLPVDCGPNIVDKFPFNLTRAPLLWRLFPNAKFIFAVRHPMDVCLSCFMQAFQPSAATSPFLSMPDTVRAYTSLMDMWLSFASKVDMELTNIRYEDMVENQEAVSRQLFDFIGVSWDDKVMKFYEHAQQSVSVTNPSYHQVVQPIYADAMQRWRRYDAQLTEFYPQIAAYLPAFRYDEA